ncbi:M13 family peptidase [Altererythrobacter xixiisoli]|uniref:M13 family peptidase n=1 Tax=Croceibacterium xixiisoli TaxID=1476466 RepID=A0A6I4TY37_9SPHN|nr:M13 family metallopeptidase [Croceibacterium xixiisoli]MXP00863.1 M13 family peptidase [Croceibacterium xixiisoli]
MRISFVAALLLSSCAILTGTTACKMAEESSTPAPGTQLGINPAWMDTSVKPGDDWFTYADGAWVKSTEIPADRSSIGGFWIANEETDANLASLIADLRTSDAAAGSDAALVKTYYETYLDTAAIDAAGVAPLREDFSRIAAIQDKAGLSAMLGSRLRADVDPLNATNFETGNLFGLFVTQALVGGEVMPYLLQGGLGMPEREYYLSSAPEMAAHRSAYRRYIADLLAAGGLDNPAARASRIYDLEMKIAAAHATREQSNDWQIAKQVWSPADFTSKAPGIDWPAFFKAASLGNQQRFNAYHAQAIPRLARLVGSEPLEAWKDWLIFHSINDNADVLPKRIDDLSFAFYGTQLQGTPQQRARDKRALASVNQWLGDALGKLYVEKFFPASSRATVDGMVGNIKDAFAKRVEAIDWLAPDTRKEALAKVRSMQVSVGYPDRWTDYGSLEIRPGAAFANKQAAELLQYRNQLAKIGKPLDRSEWWMNAQLVNAINLPVQNALNFPAGILQPPFFDPQADAAYNYGAIGAVIGHEISHSFDNNGAEFDASGAMRNWWTDADRSKFDAAGAALSAQFDSYRPFPDLAVNGRLTLGENIADLAGLAAAYDAYRASLNGKEAPVIQGYTGDQRFFIAFAQAWATKMRDNALRQRIATDGHAPGMYRALTVRNLDAWYKAFDVKEGDKLYLPPEQRIRIW